LASRATRLQGRVEYKISKNKKILLRLTEIPKKYPWVERDEDFKVLPPALGDAVICENIEDISLESSDGAQNIFIPKATKFYALVSKLNPSKHFQKDAFVELEFYKLETPSEVVLLGSDLLKADTENIGFTQKLKKTASLGAYTLGGALAGPWITYQIIGSLGLHPHTMGASAAFGGALGLVYGIQRKGKFYDFEPGKEIELKLENSWLISLAENSPEALKPLAKEPNATAGDFDLEILSVKKTRNIFGDSCLAVTLKYKNKTDEALRYSSFTLVDSLGKEYEPSPQNFKDEVFGELPRLGTLTLCYPVEFLKTVHTLQVKRMFKRQLLSEARVLLN
jgi:hypothetical protein